jgi:regulator of replication initiation timing
VTPLYTTILTEQLNQLTEENRKLKLEVKGLRAMVVKLQRGEDILGSGD